METLEEKELSARNSSEKPKWNAENRDRVSLLPRRGSKYCLSRQGAVLGRKPAFSRARSGPWEGRASAWLRVCLRLPVCSAPSSLLWRGTLSPGTPTGDLVTPNLCPAAIAPGPDSPAHCPFSLLGCFQEFPKNFLPFPSLPHD